MDRITTSHKGLEIYFSEFDEKWTCSAISKSHESLPKLKKAIDSWDRKVRKASKVPAHTLQVDLPAFRGSTARGQGDPGAKFNATEIVEFKGRSRYNRDKIEVAAMPDGRSRRTFNLNNLVKDTPENHAILERANVVAGEIWPLLSRFWMILEELEYLTEEDVAALKEIAERNPDDV